MPRVLIRIGMIVLTVAVWGALIYCMYMTETYRTMINTMFNPNPYVDFYLTLSFFLMFPSVLIVVTWKSWWHGKAEEDNKT